MKQLESYFTVQYYCPIQSKQKTRKLKTYEMVKQFLEDKKSLVTIKRCSPNNSILIYKGSARNIVGESNA